MCLYKFCGKHKNDDDQKNKKEKEEKILILDDKRLIPKIFLSIVDHIRHNKIIGCVALKRRKAKCRILALMTVCRASFKRFNLSI